MLAKKGSFSDFKRTIRDVAGKGKKFAIETKYDGDRIMCHKDGGARTQPSPKPFRAPLCRSAHS